MRLGRMLRYRLFSKRILALMFLVLGFLIYCYYSIGSQDNTKPKNRLTRVVAASQSRQLVKHEQIGLTELNILSSESPITSTVVAPTATDIMTKMHEQCPVLKQADAIIDTSSIFSTFEFLPSWLRTKEFWDKSFEDRYEKLHKDNNRPKLKVIVVPHSHNDPGWLKTFEQYYDWKTQNIINNIVEKLRAFPNMTFIWTEISFLNAWWERSHPVKQKALKQLIKDGRLEITTGGWVMPDEACTHIYSLIDQFIEGHQWVKTNLGISPKTGWSIDPFGHGPTVPYILDNSGIEGSVIQRIHYAWKQWFARHQTEEFHWLTGWNPKKQPSMIVHNLPFDIYSIKSTCGPHPATCLSFDFRKIPGEYTEYTAKHEEITDQNLQIKSRTLMEEYERIGSLTRHNVVLVPLGDDFRYEYGEEFDAQYTNYMKMFEYINSHSDQFNADVRFGTPTDYFNAIKERHPDIPTLKGDFFVYSEIFSEGKPAYWSGYYTTRPYIKIIARLVEHQLRSAEILFTLVSNYIKQTASAQSSATEKKMEKHYEQLIDARRNLGLFQHHDAITGTSKAAVMYDYGNKLFNSLYYCVRLQETALAIIMIPDSALHTQNILQSETEWETYGKPSKKLQISYIDKNKVVVFNPLAESRTEVITLSSNTSNIRVYDTREKEYPLYQVAPIIDMHDDGTRAISDISFDISFVATIPPLTSVTYKIEKHTNTSHHCAVFCNNCNPNKLPFQTKKMMTGDVQLENSVLKLLVNRHTGFLRQVYRKDIRRRNTVEIQFSAYQSAQRHSGAYLFMPDYDAPEKDVLRSYADWDALLDDNIIIVAGLVTTEITSMYTPFLQHTIRIYNIDDPVLSRAVYIENVVDFGNPPENRETELFMRIQTDIQNGDLPEFYTDQNGFQYQKRVKVQKLGIEGNYYPITTMAWLQDEQARLTLITNHAQGAAAFEPGRLEVMLERRTLYDDFRGIGEGLVDNKPTTFQNWLLLEAMPAPARSKRETSANIFNFVNERNFDTFENNYELPSQTADYLSRTFNYPVNVYLLDTSEVGDIEVKSSQTFLTDFPNGIHLVNLRTITDYALELFPSTESYVVLQRPGVSCNVGNKHKNISTKFRSTTTFDGLNIKNITAVSLTGLKSFNALKDMSDIHLDPMEVKTYKIRF